MCRMSIIDMDLFYRSCWIFSLKLQFRLRKDWRIFNLPQKNLSNGMGVFSPHNLICRHIKRRIWLTRQKQQEQEVLSIIRKNSIIICLVMAHSTIHDPVKCLLLKKKIRGLKWLLLQNSESIMRHLPVMLWHVIGDILLVDKTKF